MDICLVGMDVYIVCMYALQSISECCVHCDKCNAAVNAYVNDSAGTLLVAGTANYRMTLH